MADSLIWTKICANTTLADARLAAEAGASAVGFVFAPSKRQVTVEQVAAIVPALPAELEKIGVFVDASSDAMEGALRNCNLTGVQLHWDAPLALTAEMRRRLGSQKKVLRVMHFAAGALSLEALKKLTDPSVDAVLVDSRSATAAGGTGQSFDWIAASQTLFQTAKDHGVKLVVAGGLDPANVAEAIRVLAPWGVDVASGVEASPGRKDAAKVQAFVKQAQQPSELAE